ncbi:MAG: DoxX family protein, partial [Bacteroidia bacterium]|nr:DoxX family protein [Bacteroidia bacterium]
YRHLPVIDFRPYAIEKNLQEQMQFTPDKVQFYYLLKNKKTGEQKEFKNWPENWENDWDYVSPRTEIIEKGIPPHVHDFNMYDADGADYTQEFLSMPGYKFMLVAYDLTKSDENAQHTINDFATLCEKDKIPFIGLTGSAKSVIDVFRHDHNSMFQYYQCDETSCKTIIRSNPGLVLLNGATVVAMWHYNDFPSFDEVKEKFLSKQVPAMLEK